MQSPNQPSPGEILARAQSGEPLADILKEEDNDSSAEEHSSPAEEQAPTAPEAEELSEQNLVDEAAEEPPQDIDYDQMIPIKNREPVKLSELKDLATAQLEAQGKAEIVSEKERETRSYLMNLQKELEGVAILAQSKGLLDNDMLQALQQVSAQQTARNKQQIVTLIPEWSTPEAQTADIEKMVSFGEQYSVPREYMENIAFGLPSVAWMLRDVANSWHQTQTILNNRKPPKQQRSTNRKVSRQTRNQELRQKGLAKGASFQDKKAAAGAILLDAIGKKT